MNKQLFVRNEKDRCVVEIKPAPNDLPDFTEPYYKWLPGLIVYTYNSEMMTDAGAILLAAGKLGSGLHLQIVELEKTLENLQAAFADALKEVGY